VARLRQLRALTATLPEPVLVPAARRRVADAALAALDARPQRRRRWAWTAGLSTAAAAALVLLAVKLTHRPPMGDDQEVRTGPGENRLVQLGDRASAFVSERSVVRVGRAAPLRIVAGRVRLVVRPDRAHPFVVRTAAADAIVYGTEFDVDVDGDTTNVRVGRGEVELRNGQGSRQLWTGETARARVGGAPRRIERIVPIVLDDGPAEIEERPAPKRPRD